MGLDKAAVQSVLKQLKGLTVPYEDWETLQTLQQTISRTFGDARQQLALLKTKAEALEAQLQIAKTRADAAEAALPPLRVSREALQQELVGVTHRLTRFQDLEATVELWRTTPQDFDTNWPAVGVATADMTFGELLAVSIHPMQTGIGDTDALFTDEDYVANCERAICIIGEECFIRALIFAMLDTSDMKWTRRPPELVPAGKPLVSKFPRSLPKPSVAVPEEYTPGWSPWIGNGVLLNPAVLGLGPYPAVVCAEEWGAAVLQHLLAYGIEQTAVDFLYVLRAVFGTRHTPHHKKLMPSLLKLLSRYRPRRSAPPGFNSDAEHSTVGLPRKHLGASYSPLDRFDSGSHADFMTSMGNPAGDQVSDRDLGYGAPPSQSKE